MAEPAITQDEQRLKQSAMRRLMVALALIAAAIVALALLDRYNAAQKKPEAIPAPPREAPETRNERPATQTPPVSTREELQKQPSPPPPPVVSNPELPSAPPAASESTKQPITPPTPENPAASGEQPVPSAVESKTAPGMARKAPGAPSSPATAEPAPSTKGFLVQVGLFTSGANAKRLQDKLAQKGIPTHTETRVVVGPFQDRAEAEAVIRQLKEMGLEGVVVAPPGSQ